MVRYLPPPISFFGGLSDWKHNEAINSWHKVSKLKEDRKGIDSPYKTGFKRQRSRRKMTRATITKPVPSPTRYQP
jgi:hypothetical protein